MSPRSGSTTQRRRQTARPSKPSLRSPTRAWTSSASRRCAISSARWANPASAATTPMTWPPDRDQRRLQNLRIRRHPEPRHHRNAFQRHPARRTHPAAEHRVLRPAGAPVRIPIFLRHGAHARLLALDDPVWRRPLHARQESRHGALAPHSHPVSRRLAFAHSLPRLRRRESRFLAIARARESRPVLHQHARRPAPGTAHPAAAAQGHEADRHDHRRQALGAHPRRRPHLQERLRPRSRSWSARRWKRSPSASAPAS